MFSVPPWLDIDVYAKTGGVSTGRILVGARQPQHIIEVFNFALFPLDVEIVGGIATKRYLVYSDGSDRHRDQLTNVQTWATVGPGEVLPLDLVHVAQASLPAADSICCLEVRWRRYGAPGWSQTTFLNAACRRIMIR